MIADRGYAKAGEMATFRLGSGGRPRDFIVRTGWNMLRLESLDGTPFELISALRQMEQAPGPDPLNEPREWTVQALYGRGKTFMTIYGDVELASPRLLRCPCQSADSPATVSPLRDLIPDHVAPERPLSGGTLVVARALRRRGWTAGRHPTDGVRRQRQNPAPSIRCVSPNVPKLNSRRSSSASSTAARRTGRSCPFQEGRIVVGLDGGYIRNWEDKKSNFEVIVGRSVPEDRDARYVGLAHGYDGKPKRRLFDVLKSQGLQANQDVTFLTDGGEEIRAPDRIRHASVRARVGLVSHHDAGDRARTIRARCRSP